MRRTYFAVGALALIALLAIAGCGGGGSSTSPSTSGGGETTATTTESGGTTTTESGGGTTTSSTPEIEEEAAATKSYGGGGGETSSATAATKPAVVKVMNTPDLGKVIVDAEGMTMYDFHKDKGTTSACYGACAEAWPPLLTKGMPTTTGGAEASLIGVTKRKDGTEQVTYDGHPIYGFFEDKKPGETNGNDVDAFGGEWYALMPNGEEPEDS